MREDGDGYTWRVDCNAGGKVRVVEVHLDHWPIAELGLKAAGSEDGRAEDGPLSARLVEVRDA